MSENGVGAWLRPGQRHLQTTVAGAEAAVTLIVVGMRLGTLVQMAPSIPSGTSTSPHPALYTLSWVAALLASCAVSYWSLRRGRLLRQRWLLADLGLAVALLLIGRWAVSADNRVGTWEGWQPAYALSVALAIASVRSLAVWATGILGVLAAQAIFVSDSVQGSNLSTTIGDLLTVILISSLGRVVLNYLRRVALAAEEARETAARLAREQEEQRAQAAIHNGAAVIRLLSDPLIDETTRSQLLEQARHEAQRMRAYLRGDAGTERPGAATGPQRLSEVVERACRPFEDLNITRSLDLGAGVQVGPEVADAVQSALTSLLLNVKVHAGSRHVVLHLDADDEDRPTRWVLTVHDDGSGFDPGTVTLGVGLREVVIAELQRHDVQTQIESTPGLGTTVNLSGPTTSDRPAVAPVIGPPTDQRTIRD